MRKALALGVVGVVMYATSAYAQQSQRLATSGDVFTCVQNNEFMDDVIIDDNGAHWTDKDREHIRHRKIKSTEKTDEGLHLVVSASLGTDNFYLNTKTKKLEVISGESSQFFKCSVEHKGNPNTEE